MSEEKTTIEQVRAVKAEAKDFFSPYGEVCGVGITRVDGEYALKVNLLELFKNAEDLPLELHGVAVKCEVVGKIRPQRTRVQKVKRSVSRDTPGR